MSELSASRKRGQRPPSRRIESRLKGERNDFRRRLLFIGYLFGKLSKLGVTSYLVGGQAVEVYTGGQFSTGDIDITTSNRELTVRVLRQMKFVRTGMIWLREDIGIAVQIVGSYPSTTEKSRTIDIEGSRVNVIGVEELTINRLAAAKFWRSNPKLDVEEATVLAIQFWDSLDLEYLKRRAKEENVSDYLDSILGVAAKRGK